ncbi:hypothetical protein DPMN_173529 [Dreissena polymorpha]|uniref:Uncharacterized protein n=1 Tax=Dreissena polymorpha TaxID=45954 RepID=A0A9D4IEA2_DREPO|nr:hypothetical protein DPMN_173529 [Dreissena polymorpha]
MPVIGGSERAPRRSVGHGFRAFNTELRVWPARRGLSTKVRRRKVELAMEHAQRLRRIGTLSHSASPPWEGDLVGARKTFV